MGFDCKNCLAACRADCCHGPVPFEKAWADKQTPIRPIVQRVEVGDNAVILVAIDERYQDGKQHGVCPFLGKDDRCSVYDQRPLVCRRFGDGSHVFTTCSFQAPDGRVRSRQERRAVERQQAKAQDRAARGEPSADDAELERRMASDQEFIDEATRLFGPKK